MKVPTDIIEVLAQAHTDGPRLVLAGPRMDPKLYERTNEVLEAIGGTWGSAAAAHVFAGDAASAVAELLQAGRVTTAREAVQLSQFFPTPAAVVAELLALAEVKPGMEVLEPSAGHGAIARALVDAGCVVDCIEREAVHAELLADTGLARKLEVQDFLTVEPSPDYDRVVMNPPFTRGADIAHVTHALKFLRDGGRLVSVMSSSVAWHAPAAKFRRLVAERGGTVHALPDKAFQESGTNVSALMVCIPATRPAGDVPPPVWPTQRASATRQQDPELLLPPAIIARQIEADLMTALRAFRAVAEGLEHAVPPATEKQLALDL